MAVSIRNVAQEAGVSVSTVSKVLNHSPLISETTTKKVRAAIERLQYHPNEQARNFAKQKTYNVAFIAHTENTTAFNNPHLFAIMCGAEKQLNENGYHLIFVGLTAEQNECDTIKALIEQKVVDGIILHISAVTPDVSSVLVENKFPHIVIGKLDFNSELCWIDTNNQLSGSIAMRHLIEIKCHNIAYIGGAKQDHISLHRLQGVTRTAKDFNVSIPDNNICLGATTISDAQKITKALVDSRHPDAIICANNTIALGTMRTLKDLQIKIPDETAVISFDDYPYSRITEPPLSIVNIDVYDMGMQAGIMLLRKIKTPSLQVQSYTTLPVLIVRGSTHLC